MKKVSSPLAGEVARRAGGDVGIRQSVATPGWLWAALLAGAVVTVWWAWFVSGFLSEPSAVGRVLVVLLTSICLSVVSGLAGAAGAMALLRKERWDRPLAWFAAVALTLSGLGAIGGIPALVGLVWSRKAASQ
jgi:hypothetical protein